VVSIIVFRSLLNIIYYNVRYKDDAFNDDNQGWVVNGGRGSRDSCDCGCLFLVILPVDTGRYKKKPSRLYNTTTTIISKPPYHPLCHRVAAVTVVNRNVFHFNSLYAGLQTTVHTFTIKNGKKT